MTAGSAEIGGVVWGRVRAHDDSRGAFREVWRASALPGSPRFVQANLSTSRVGVLRALHYHRRQLDHWIVVAGRVFVALVDLRPVKADTTAEPLVQTRRLSIDDSVSIPPYVAHGFLAIEPTQLLYLVTTEYDGTDELGVAWNDPEIAVPWPVQDVRGELVLSDRDRGNPSLTSIRGRI